MRSRMRTRSAHSVYTRTHQDFGRILLQAVDGRVDRASLAGASTCAISARFGLHRGCIGCGERSLSDSQASEHLPSFQLGGSRSRFRSMSENMTDVVEQLRVEESRLLVQVKELRSDARAAEAELERIRGALVALRGKQAVKRKASKQAVTQKEVDAAIRATLQGVGSMPSEELRKRVEERLRASGWSMSGFALRFSKGLHSSELRTQDGLVSVA